jgi:hypothetical protein
MIVLKDWLLLLQLCQGIVHVVSAFEIVENKIVVYDAVNFKRLYKLLFLLFCRVQAELVVAHLALFIGRWTRKYLTSDVPWGGGRVHTYTRIYD